MTLTGKKKIITPVTLVYVHVLHRKSYFLIPNLVQIN